MEKYHGGVSKREIVKDELEEKTTFPCKICNKKFVEDCYLQAHMKNKHSSAKIKSTKSKHFPCEFCNKRFVQDFYLIQHMKREHSSVREKENDEFFDGKESNSTFPCKLCGNVFIKDFYLEKHMQKAHPKAYHSKAGVYLQL